MVLKVRVNHITIRGNLCGGNDTSRELSAFFRILKREPILPLCWRRIEAATGGKRNQYMP